MIYLILTLIVCCSATILFELIPAIFKTDKKEWIKASLICNIITNPIINTLLLLLMIADLSGTFYTVSLFILEVAVILFEGYIYKKRLNKTSKMCITYSLIANLISALLGVVLFILYNILMPITIDFPAGYLSTLP